MRIAIISVGVLPLPAVKGGSVEKNVTEPLLEENERAASPLDITVFSIADPEAEAAAMRFRHTKFEYIEMRGYRVWLARRLRHFFNRIPHVYIGNAFIARVVSRMKQLPPFEAVMLMNAPEYAIVLRRHFRGKIIQHMDNDYLSVPGWKNARSIACSDKFVSVSSFLSGRIDAPAERKCVLYPGINVEDYNAARNQALAGETRARYGISPKDTVFVFAGRLIKGKGVLELVDAFCKLDRALPTKLFIIGSRGFGKTERDAFFKELESRAAPRRNDIVFTGYLPRSETALIYGAADIAVFPSIWNEPLGYVVLEAMAFGLPLIVTDSGGMPEMHRGFAYVVPRGENFTERLAQTMGVVISEPENRLKKALAARQLLTKFTNQQSYSNFVSILSE